MRHPEEGSHAFRYVLLDVLKTWDLSIFCLLTAVGFVWRFWEVEKRYLSFKHFQVLTQGG
jgi:hypothetical protein